MEPIYSFFWLTLAAMSLLLFYYLTAKIQHWETMLLLGFASSCTPLFLRHGPWPYNLVRFPAAFFWLWHSYGVFTIGGTIALMIAWFVAVKRGEKAGFNEYRQIITELMEHAETDEEREEMRKASSVSDEELEAMKEDKAIMLGWLPTTSDQLTLRHIFKGLKQKR